VISHQLRSAENLGALARVMANFGFQRLILSDPITHDFRGAEKLGVGAEPVLEKMAVSLTLAEALKGVVYAVGTTSRAQLKRFKPLTAEQGIASLHKHSARGPVAIVLGGEKRGLSDDELSLCHDAMVIDTHADQPSMNVSHAAAVFCFLCSRVEAPKSEAEPGAPGELLQRLEQKLREAFEQSGFLTPQSPEHVLKELSRSLVKGALTKREAEIWISALTHLARR
jgi:tRNA/rRNA methyltransferase